jgi:type I restriction enzyme S subunit
MYSIRVSKELEDRIDAEFYNPEALAAISKIEKIGNVTTLGAEISDGYRVVYHGTDSAAKLDPSQKLGFLSPAQISNDGEINFDSVDELPLYYKDDYPKGLGKAGELLIEVKGNVSKVTVLPATFPKNLMISGSLYKALLSSNLDSRYALAFLKSRHGQLLKNRLTSNTIINYIGKEDLYSIPLLLPDRFAQKYIGDKVRKAEQLRAWAKEIYTDTEEQFHKEIGEYDTSESRFERVSVGLLDDRLDQNHYRNNLLNCLRKVTAIEHVNLGNSEYFEGLTDGDHGNPAYGKGPLYIRTSEMTGNLLYQHKMVSINSEYSQKISKSCWANEGDIVFSIVGTIGLTAVVGYDTEGVMSRGVAKVSSKNLPGYFVKSYFRTAYFYDQLIRHSVGSVQRGVYLSALEKIVIPIFGQDCMRVIADKEKLADTLSFLSNYLILASKFLVEALIDEKTSEQHLILAQQALESGDDSLDKALLSRLKVNGIDTESEPLFSDLDQLYDLLAQSQQFADEHQ